MMENKNDNGRVEIPIEVYEQFMQNKIDFEKLTELLKEKQMTVFQNKSYKYLNSWMRSADGQYHVLNPDLVVLELKKQVEDLEIENTQFQIENFRLKHRPFTQLLRELFK